MIEERVKSFLDAEFDQDNIPVVLEIPKQIPESFIIFQRVDIGRTNRIDAVTLEFRSYGPSKYTAAVLDEKLRAAMDKLHETTDITCEIGGGNDNTDTELKRYRYRSYYNLYY